MSADPYFDLQLILTYPGLPWFKPLILRAGGQSTDFACRVCIARYGVVGPKHPRTGKFANSLEVRHFPTTLAAFREHMATEHHVSL